MASDYDPHRVETKWQERWAREKVWEATENPSLRKYYVLEMFPYPSGRLHMGHVRNYTLGDVIARFRKAQGYNVMHPMGWDAFGLPAENAAIKNKVHPEKWTLENIATMRTQLKRLGFGYDWTREVTTCLPEYYKWEQLVFTRMLEKGLAYRKKSRVNWCPSCQTVLANEQVEEGRCWRCESETTTQELAQWCLRTTAYTQELLEDLDTLTGWPERIRSMQRNWIGRSEGAEVEFTLQTEGASPPQKIVVFTTRPDTLFGVTFLAVAPDHALIETLLKGRKEEPEARAFIQQCLKQKVATSEAETAEKLGCFTGSYARHPLTDAKIPVYIANFVVADYGTGALMAVPAHDARDHEFAKKYRLPIIEVIRPKTGGDSPSVESTPFVDAGTLVNSGAFNGMESESAKTKITSELERQGKGRKTIQYRMRDWGLSRQRYWGAPIPVVYCTACGIVAVPERDLPVVLPKDVDFTGEGGSPLARHPDFLKTKCPKCGASDARRETDTMDTFMESSWYYLRYCSPHETSAPFDPDQAKYWLGVDQYIGGVEHATMHLLYFRFFHKALRDLGFLPKDMNAQDIKEPVRNLLNQGIVYKDGAKMSKSKGNVVEPDLIVGQYGADTARVFSMFAAPPEKVLEWSDKGVEGAHRFLSRVWRLIEKYDSILKGTPPFQGQQKNLSNDANRKLRAKTHQTIEKVTQDFDNGYHFNTAIAAIMELVNELYAYTPDFGVEEHRAVLREAVEATVRLLHPFAPHITEELWERLGHSELLCQQPLPKADPDALVREVMTIVVQVNGKLRASLEVSKSLDKDKIIALAREDTRLQQHLAGKTVRNVIFVPGRLVNFVVAQ